MLFTAVSRPSSQWFCLVQPPKHSCLKSVPKHEWKRSSHTQSVSVFRRVVTALSSQILFLCFLGFCFPSGHDTFSVPIGHLFPIFGAELKWYLSCNSCVPTQKCSFTKAVWVWPKNNKVLRRCYSTTPPVQRKKGISSSALGRLSTEMNTLTQAATANKQPASAGTLGERGRWRPSAQVLTL